MFNSIFPAKYWPDGQRMTALEESEHWVVDCSHCDWESTVAAIGGRRYRARGVKTLRLGCPRCGTRRRMTVTWREPV